MEKDAYYFFLYSLDAVTKKINDGVIRHCIL